MAGSLSWAHTDSSRNLHQKGLEAYALARSGGPWPDSPEGVRLFRAWRASILATIANLGPNPTRVLSQQDLPHPEASIPQGGAYVVKPEPNRRRLVQFDFQQQLVYAMASIVGASTGASSAASIELSANLAIATVDGAPAELAKPPARSFQIPGVGEVPILTAGYDTGLLPAIPIVTGLVIVACVGILAGAVGWITSQASEVLSVGLQQRGKTTAAVQAMTTAAELVEAHQARESKEQRELDYDAEEQKLLETLRATIQSTAGWTAPKLQSTFRPGDITKPLGLGLGIGEIIFLALAGYALVKNT